MSYYCGFRERLERNWAWIVLVASFCNQFISSGIAFSFGIYNVEFLEEFKDTKANTAWISSIHIAFLLGSGPLVAYAMDRTSFRMIACLGAAIFTGGAILSAFATELFHLYLTIGIIMGAGASMVYTPSVVLVGICFTKYHTFATSITTGGSAIGAIIFPIVFTQIIETYTWLWSLFIIAAFCAQTMVFSALLRPSDLEVDAEIDSVDENAESETEVLNVYRNRHTDLTVKLAKQLLSNTESDPPLEELETTKSIGDDSSRYSRLAGTGHIGTAIPAAECNDTDNGGEMLVSIKHDHRQGNDRNHSQERYHCTAHKHKSHEVESLILQTDLGNITETNGRVKLLSQISSTHSGPLNLAEKTEVMMKEVNEIEDCSRRRASGNPQRSSLWKRIDVAKRRLSDNILYNVDFLIFFINHILWNVGGCIAIVMTADYLYFIGADKSEIGPIITIAGLGDILGTCIASAIGDWKHCNRALGYSILCMLAGILISLFLVAPNPVIVGVFSSLAGFTIGWFMSWVVAIITDIVGTSRLGEAFGYLMLASGVGSLAGPPFGGWLFDITGNYTVTFIMAGVLTAASGLLMLIVPLKKILRQTRDKSIH